MATSLTPPMTSNPGATPSKRPRPVVPIIPAIPRSLEKKKYKKDVKESENGQGTGSPGPPISLKENESKAESAIAETQAVSNGALNGFDGKDDVHEHGAQESVIDTGSEKEIPSTEGGATFQSPLVRNEQKPTTFAVDGPNITPVHAEDFGIEKHGFRLPPPSYPKPSPPPTISTNFSSGNDKAIASEETSQTAEEEDGSNTSQQSSAGIHVTLNAAAPTFHAHPTPPTDATTSPAESSHKGYEAAQAIHLQQGPTPPSDDTTSLIQIPYQGYEISQNISFYAPPQSSNDPSSPDYSLYQGYTYAPASYGYSPESHASQQYDDSPNRTEVDVPYEHRYGPQPPYYNNQSSHPILGSQPPLTPSRTPLDPSAQPWSYSNGTSLTMNPFGYGYMPPYNLQPTFESPVRSGSQGTMKSDKSAQTADFDGRPKPDQLNAFERKTPQLIRPAYDNMNDCMTNYVPLIEHLLCHFNVEEYSDCYLTLLHENLRFEKTTWSLSSLLLAQSHKLRDLLRSAGQIKEGKTFLEIRLTDRFITPWAMNSALRVLYGESPETFQLAIAQSTLEPRDFSMDVCLAFAAAGHVLGLEIVVLKGLRFAAIILNWDNLEHALSFGLESGPNRETSASFDVIPLAACSPVWSGESDPSFAKDLTPPSSGTESRPERSGDEALLSVVSHASEIRNAQDLQTCCLRWIAANLDDSWEFDPSARPLAEVDRLPTTAESRSPLFKSRLSRIQFGDHPSEMHVKASDRNVLVSSIALSLPFMALKYVLDLGSQPLLCQLHLIVNERERRRQIVLQSKSVPWSERLAAREHEWAEVGYTECVETTGDGQAALARTFTGIDRQMSEPGTPSQQKR